MGSGAQGRGVGRWLRVWGKDDLEDRTSDRSAARTPLPKPNLQILYTRLLTCAPRRLSSRLVETVRFGRFECADVTTMKMSIVFVSVWSRGRHADAGRFPGSDRVAMELDGTLLPRPFNTTPKRKLRKGEERDGGRVRERERGGGRTEGSLSSLAEGSLKNLTDDSRSNLVDSS